MPTFKIEASAQLDGIKSVSFPNDYPWFCNMLCGNCGTRADKPLVLMSSEQVEGIRGGAAVNLRRTCKFCKRVSDFKIIKEGMSYTADDSPNWSTILRLECRGAEITDIALADDTPLETVGNDGFVFEDVLIENGEFYGYDEKSKVEASITEFTTRIVKE